MQAHSKKFRITLYYKVLQSSPELSLCLALSLAVGHRWRNFKNKQNYDKMAILSSILISTVLNELNKVSNELKELNRMHVRSASYKSGLKVTAA